MKIDDIKNIAVIGAGNMGHQISMLCAIHGFKTVCTDINADILKKAEAFADNYLAGRVQKGRLTEAQAKAARANLIFTNNLATAIEDSDYVIEAVLEVSWKNTSRANTVRRPARGGMIIQRNKHIAHSS